MQTLFIPTQKFQIFSRLFQQRCYSLTGLKKEDFENLYNSIKNTEWEFKTDLRDALGSFLTRLRLGVSNAKLMSLFPIASTASISRMFAKIRELLNENFVKKYLGFEHISRGKLFNIESFNILKHKV